MKFSISQVCTLPAPFDEDIAAFADTDWRHVEIWLTKLETHLEKQSADTVKNLFTEKNIRPVAAAYQGGLLLSQGEARKTHFDHFKKRLAICEEFGIPLMLLVADFTQRVDPTMLERSVVSLKQAAQWAAGFGVRLALEFRGADTFCSCLDTALQLVDHCGEPNVGVCLDWFHYYRGPSKPEDLERLTKENLFHVQICDVAGTPREAMTDSDRILPGDGDFRYETLVNRLREIGYEGAVSLEVMNAVLWQVKPTQVAELGLTALRRVIG